MSSPTKQGSILESRVSELANVYVILRNRHHIKDISDPVTLTGVTILAIFKDGGKAVRFLRRLGFGASVDDLPGVGECVDFGLDVVVCNAVSDL